MPKQALRETLTTSGRVVYDALLAVMSEPVEGYDEAHATLDYPLGMTVGEFGVVIPAGTHARTVAAILSAVQIIEDIAARFAVEKA